MPSHTTLHSDVAALRRFVVSVASAASAVTAFTAAPAGAQYPNTFVLPRGVLRVSFEPSYTAYDHRFDPDGNVEPLGRDLSSDSAGSALIPTLRAPQSAVRSITGNPSYRMSAGAFRTELDADVRRFPLNFELGITDRLTVTASIPIVNTRAQVDFVVDSTTANVGWNQAVPEGGNPTGLSDIQTLQTQLEAAAASIEAQIAAGAFGCPTSAMCDQARDLVARTRQLGTDLWQLTGVAQAGVAAATLPPFVPLTSSPEGQAIVSTLGSIAAEMQTFGAPAVTGTLPLPTQRLGTDDIQAMLTSMTLGYELLPLQFAKFRNTLGDAELGLRWGLVQQRSLRTVLSATIRLPTGRRDLPDHLVDIGTGDRQTDVVGAVEAVWAPGNVLALALSASYTLQLADRLPRRVTSHDRPITLATSEQVVERNLGDVIELGIYPSLLLSDVFTAYASAYYSHKQTDRFSGPQMLDTGFPGGASADALELDTRMRTLSFGGGVYYRSSRHRHGAALPIEAGVDYRTAFRGAGGLTPKATRLNFYLRLFFRVFGGAASSPQSAISNP